MAKKKTEENGHISKQTLRLSAEQMEKIESLKIKVHENTLNKAVIKAINIVLIDMPELRRENEELREMAKKYAKKYLGLLKAVRGFNQIARGLFKTSKTYKSEYDQAYKQIPGFYNTYYHSDDDIDQYDIGDLDDLDEIVDYLDN